jgi:YD repeat-containing protein
MALKLAYIYDDDEHPEGTSSRADGSFKAHRVVKALNDNSPPTHYHYDSEGRLIAETDGLPGAVVREYVWLGLTPIASYNSAPANDNCDEARKAELQALIADKLTRIADKQQRIINLDVANAHLLEETYVIETCPNPCNLLNGA